MRARVRKDDTQVTVRKSASQPWAVRVAATLPRGARVTNPLFGDDPADSVAVIDAGGALSIDDMCAVAKKAAHALIVWDQQSDDARAAFIERGFSPFTIESCDLLFAATYELPNAPWLKATEKGDFAVGAGTSGKLQPEQESKIRRVKTKAATADNVGLLTKSARTVKSEDGTDERYVLGIVLEPDSVDSQGDTISASEIRQAAHRYMEEHGNVGLQHQVFVNGKIKIIESYIAPTAFTIGDELVKAGTWLMAFRVNDDSIWEAIKAGLLDGLSIGGTGLKIPVS